MKMSGETTTSHVLQCCSAETVDACDNLWSSTVLADHTTSLKDYLLGSHHQSSLSEEQSREQFKDSLFWFV